MKRAIIAFVVLVAGCGRYKPPLPPEMFAPKAVDPFVVTARPDGVQFAWTGSDEDRRGKELKFVDGYAIQRKTIEETGDETNPKISFDTIGFVKDTHVLKREELRKEARAEGRIGRTVEAPGEFMQFSYLDSTAQNGKTYLYQVVPQNQGGVDGVVRQVYRVIFKGTSSDITVLPSQDVLEDENKLDDPGALS